MKNDDSKARTYVRAEARKWRRRIAWTMRAWCAIVVGVIGMAQPSPYRWLLGTVSEGNPRMTWL